MQHTVDPFTVSMAQEHDNSRDIGWDSDTTEGDKLGNPGFDLRDGSVRSAAWGIMPRVLLEHFGLDSTWCDTVASDSLGATISSERAAEALVRRLGGGVEGVVGDRHACGDG